MSRRGGGDGARAAHPRGRGGRGGRGGRSGGEQVSFGAPTYALAWSATAGIMEFLDSLRRLLRACLLLGWLCGCDA